MDGRTKIAVAATVATLTGVALWKRWMAKGRLVEDCEAAFPTAQWVAAMRATDASSKAPVIGSNVGAGPDTLAASLAGEEGAKILEKAAELYGSSKEALSVGLINRSMFFDKRWCEALDADCKQFVVLAAGLDARAWRLPRMDKSVKVFEVDVPRAHRYKEAQLEAIVDAPALSCDRIVVDADLSDSSWPARLQAAGFDPTARSFFLIEGLLMYLPPGAPEALMHNVSTLMSAGSTVMGDTFVGCLDFMDQRLMRQLSTKWTYDFRDDDAIRALLASSGLECTTIEAVKQVTQTAKQEGATAGEDATQAKARALQVVLLAIGTWPPAIIDMVLPKLVKGDAAVRTLVQQVVEDAANFHGLRDEPREQKDRIAALILETPLSEERHGAVDFSAALQAEAKQLEKTRPARALLKRWSEGACFAFAMYKHSRRQKQGRAAGFYSIYSAYKAAPAASKPDVVDVAASA